MHSGGQKKVRSTTAGIQKCSKSPEENLKILGEKIVAGSKFHVDKPQVLGSTVQNVVVRAIWPREFVHPWTTEKMEGPQPMKVGYAGNMVCLVYCADHIYINNISYNVSTATCFDASASSSGSLILLFHKVPVTK